MVEYNVALKEFWYKVFDLSCTLITIDEFNSEIIKISNTVVDSFVLTDDEKSELIKKLLDINFKQFYNPLKCKIIF